MQSISFLCPFFFIFQTPATELPLKAHKIAGSHRITSFNQTWALCAHCLYRAAAQLLWLLPYTRGEKILEKSGKWFKAHAHNAVNVTSRLYDSRIRRFTRPPSATPRDTHKRRNQNSQLLWVDATSVPRRDTLAVPGAARATCEG